MSKKVPHHIELFKQPRLVTMKVYPEDGGDPYMRMVEFEERGRKTRVNGRLYRVRATGEKDPDGYDLFTIAGCGAKFTVKGA